MGWTVFGLLLVCTGAVLSCSDVSTTPRTLVVKGTVATGAHTRTNVVGGYVGLLEPQGPNGGQWIRLVFDPSSEMANEATTNADGTYTFTIDMSVFDHPHEYPLYLAASDRAQTLTMLSEIPRDDAVEGGELTIDINPTTTVAGQMICPGGVSPPPANTWCYSDPKSPSADNAAMIGILDKALTGNLISLETGSPPRWGPFASGFLNDPATFTEIKGNLTSQGIILGTATPASIVSTITSADLPLVHPTQSSAPPSSGGGGCKLVWDCGTSSQCASVYGGKTGSAAEPDAATCQSICKSQGACTCQGC
jgi:hypothetical protein